MYPCLIKLALYLAVPASSAPVETFQHRGKNFRPDHCRLSDQTSKRLISIQNNAQFRK